MEGGSENAACTLIGKALAGGALMLWVLVLAVNCASGHSHVAQPFVNCVNGGGGKTVCVQDPNNSGFCTAANRRPAM